MGKQYLNGVLYGTGEIIKFSPYIYSLEEREVGVHTNGKPLYEKTYRWTISDLHSSNIQSGNMYGEFWLDHVAYDEFWMCDAKLINKGTNWTVKSIPLNYPHESTVTRSNLQVQSQNDGYPFIFFKSLDSGAYNDRNSLVFYYTIRYTKTTDTPGSGHYTTKGGEAHHYSTSEQIVGTWIDGKPLYEKTLHIVNQRIGHDPDASPQNTVIPHGINNLALMVSVKPRMYDTSSELKMPSDANGWYLNSDGSINGAIRANNSSIYYYGGWGFTEASPTRHWYFTLRYTKSTD